MATHRRERGLHGRSLDPGHDRFPCAASKFRRGFVQYLRAAHVLEAPDRTAAGRAALEVSRHQQGGPRSQGAAGVPQQQGIIGMMSDHSGNSSSN